MQEWNNMLQLAMLGTGKNNIDTIAMADEAIQSVAQIIAANDALDAEEKYLQLAAVVFNYKQMGALPALQTEIAANEAAAETLPTCNAAQTQILKDIWVCAALQVGSVSAAASFAAISVCSAGKAPICL